jgi:hypothetical protein
MIKIAFVSQTLTPMGGGGKDIAITLLNLNRQIFDPYTFSLCDPAAWRDEYGIPADRCRGVDIWDVVKMTEALKGFDVVYLMVGTTNEPVEYETIWAACAANGVKVRVMRIVFGLGNPKPEMADLFLTSSMDSHLVGVPCRGCHVVYPPLPAHKYVGDRVSFRHKYGISEYARVIGYACSAHCPEFFEVARLFYEAKNPSIFLSALARPDNVSMITPNVLFCGTLRQREMASLYEASDVVLHTRTESFGYSPYQAMAATVPVVALWTSSRNAFAETMYPEGGWLAKTPAGLVAALNSVPTFVFGPSRERVAYRRTGRMVPENSVRRLEVLILRALSEKGHFTGIQVEPPNSYVTDNDVQMWRTSKAEIEKRLETELYI